MKKKLLSFLLALVMLCTMLPGMSASAASAKIFTDVKASDWFAGQVYALVEAGVISGDDDTHFRPNGTVTRAQFVTALARAAESDEVLAGYDSQKIFSDVRQGIWYAKYVNWCYENNIASGKGAGTFDPEGPVTRQEAASFLVNFANNVESVSLESKQERVPFSDDDRISGWAKENVYLCQESGVLSGSEGKFRPTDTMKRCEMASTLLRLLGIPAWDKSQIPTPPVDTSYKAPVTGSKTVAGVSVTYVEFDPSRGYTAQAVIANNKLYTTETAASIASRTGATVAVNGAFYSCYAGGDNTTYSTLISDRKVLRLDNAAAPYKPAFVIDGNGKASIEFFKTNQTVSLVRGGASVSSWDNVGCNIALSAGDGTPMMYTPVFGSKVPGAVVSAVAVDGNGVVTKVYPSGGTDLPIPANGSIFFQRKKRSQWDTYLNGCQVGDQLKVSVSYEGSSTQDIVTALSCGPTLVKNGKAYGSAETYKQEGFTDPHVISEGGARMAIGVKADGTVVIACSSGYLSTMSQVMAGLGCQTAMNLDGGASCALYASGSWRVTAGRNMSNMLVFKH